MSSEVASRYSEALFEIAKENNSIASKKEQAEKIVEIFSSSKELPLFLRAIKITPEEKKKTIDSIFKDVLDEDVIHLIKLTIDKHRSEYLPEMMKEYIVLANEELGIVTGVVQSARPLSKEDMDRIIKALEKKLAKKVELKNTINENLIAGIKVVVGNNVTDVSVQRQIQEMKEILLKGGSQA